MSFLHGLHIEGRGQDVLVLFGLCYRRGGGGEDVLVLFGLWPVIGYYEFEFKGVFSMSSFYRILCRGGVGESPWRRIWITDVSSKVAFFVWSAAFGRILQLIIWFSVGIFWLIIVVCAVVMRNWWVIC
ncbi:hypothetical protein CsSME_00002328 [Camellia sinensis var. sinensis]